jgi:hypothetical protein
MALALMVDAAAERAEKVRAGAYADSTEAAVASNACRSSSEEPAADANSAAGSHAIAAVHSGSSCAIAAFHNPVLLLLQVKGAVFSQHSALQQIEGMCRLHRPEQKPAVSPRSIYPCKALVSCMAWS